MHGLSRLSDAAMKSYEATTLITDSSVLIFAPGIVRLGTVTAPSLVSPQIGIQRSYWEEGSWSNIRKEWKRHPKGFVFCE